LDATNPAGTKIITGKKKKQLAKHVGKEITQAQFEADLVICFNALTRCWDLAF
jgi:putative ATP-dependent endonuclease of OLD family